MIKFIKILLTENPTYNHLNLFSKRSKKKIKNWMISLKMKCLSIISNTIMNNKTMNKTKFSAISHLNRKNVNWLFY